MDFLINSPNGEQGTTPMLDSTRIVSREFPIDVPSPSSAPQSHSSSSLHLLELPRELRNRIWFYTVLAQTCYITQPPLLPSHRRKLQRAVPFERPVIRILNDRGHMWTNIYGDDHADGYSWLPDTIICLLLANRSMHKEICAIMHAHFTFFLDRGAMKKCLIASLPPALQGIRHLQFKVKVLLARERMGEFFDFRCTFKLSDFDVLNSRFPRLISVTLQVYPEPRDQPRINTAEGKGVNVERLMRIAEAFGKEHVKFFLQEVGPLQENTMEIMNEFQERLMRGN